MPAAKNERPGCSFCRREVDHAALGLEMKAEREKMGMTQADVAMGMGVSNTFVCDLELGRRNWTPKMVEKYQRAVGTKP